MSDVQQDNSSEMRRKFLDIAASCVADLRAASDAGVVATPWLVGLIQEKISRAIEQVHYGFHPSLEE